MAASKPTIEASASKSAEEDQSSKVEGSYIEERKRNIEYLDLQTEKTLKNIREQTSKEVTQATSNDSSKKSPSVGSTDNLATNDNDLPPGEEHFENQSFNSEFSEMYSEEGDSSLSKLKRTITQANLNNPENRYLTLDEIEERKKAKMGGSTPTKCATTIRYASAHK